MAACRPSAMSCVTLSTSPPARVLRLLVIPRTRPREYTLLPTTMLPGLQPLRVRQKISLPDKPLMSMANPR